MRNCEMRAREGRVEKEKGGEGGRVNVCVCGVFLGEDGGGERWCAMKL